MAESGEFDVLVSDIDHSELAGRRRARAGPPTSPTTCCAACAGTDLFPCVITVTTADPPVEDLRWAREHDIPLLKGTLPGLRALASRIDHQRGCRPPASRSRRQPLAGGGALAELDSAAIAPDYGMPYVRAERCADPDEAVAAAERIGYPVVVKIDNVAHKARVGGVALNLIDAAAVREAAERMGGAVIVAEQVARRRRGAGRHGARLGLRRDRGGRHRRRPGRGARPGHRQPRAARRARAPASWCRACRRCAGCWAAPPPDGLIDAVVAVSRLAAEHPEIAEIDVNPLLVSAERAVALDCLIVLKGRRADERRRSCTRSAARPRGSRSTGRRS